MKALILLGNRMNDDGSLSEPTRKRLALAEERYLRGDIDLIIVSGGLANPAAGITEARAMKKALTARGIPAYAVAEEDDSLTTVQNAKYSVPLACAKGADEIVLCSSREHIKRRYLNPVRLFRRAMRKAGYAKSALEVFTDER